MTFDFIVLFVVIAALYLKLPKRDFYLVELRQWCDSTMAVHARNYVGYSRSYLKNTTLKIFSKKSGALVLHHSNQGSIKIEQVIFSSLEAAQIYFESLKSLASESKSNAVEVNLWRVVARTRKGAHIISPASYASREAVSLARYQPSSIKMQPIGTEFGKE